MTKQKIKLAFSWIRKKIVILLIISGTLGVAYAAVPNDIPVDLQLKAPKERILFSREIRDSKGNDIVSYLYISNKEVKQQEYKGIKEIMGKRTKNAQIFSKGKNEKGEEEFVGRFYSGEPFYQDNDKWFQTETATTTKVAFQRQTKVGFFKRLFFPQALADTDSFYAGVGDGHVKYDITGSQPSQANWDTAHDAVTGITADYIAEKIQNGMSIEGSSNVTSIRRGFYPTDTSALGAAAVISGAVLKLYLFDRFDSYNDGYDYLAIVKTFQASISELVVADYEDNGYDSGNETGGRAKYLAVKGSANIDITGLSTSAYNDFTLNATGRGWINKTGTTMLGLREGHDIEDNFPGDPGEVDKYSYIVTRSSEQTGTDQDPYLEVTYTVPSAEVEEVRNKVIIID